MLKNLNQLPYSAHNVNNPFQNYNNSTVDQFWRDRTTILNNIFRLYFQVLSKAELENTLKVFLEKYCLDLDHCSTSIPHYGAI